MVDANGDNSPDLVFGTPAYESQPAEFLTRSFIFLNDGTGHFYPWKLRLNGQIPTAEALAAVLACEQCSPGSMPMLFDASGDGLPDVVLTSRRLMAARPVREQTLFLHTFLADPGPRLSPPANPCESEPRTLAASPGRHRTRPW